MIINPYAYNSRTLALLNGNGTNGSTVFADSSVYANTFTAFGTAQISTAQSKFGGASMLFDGVIGTYIQSSDLNAYRIVDGQDFTIELWVYANSTTDGVFASRIDPVGFPTNAKVSWAIEQVSGSYRFAFITPSVSQINVTGAAITASEWVHLAACRKNGIITLYKNGVGGTPVSNSSGFNNPAAAAYLRLGQLLNGGGGERPFNGYIDDFKYSRIALYDGNFTPPVTEATI